MASSLLDVCRFNPTAGGTTDWTYSTAVVGYQSPTAAGVVNGATYSYRAESSDLSQWEVGIGAYNTGTGVLARTTVLFNSAGTTAKISFSAAPQVAIVALAEDLRPLVGRPQGRLTLLTATPVTSTAQNAKTTLYYTPYQGNAVPLYDGANFVDVAFSEISVATTDTTKNPAAIGASKVNDWFVWNDAGTLRLSHGPDWTSDTARSAGTALAMVNGILLNSVAITNGPAASRGTFIGTTRSNASSSLDYSFGGQAAGGTAALINVWNAYNRVNAVCDVSDSTGTWTYSSGTVRQTNASAGNRISFVSGLAEDGIFAYYQSRFDLGAASANGFSGMALDSTTVMSYAGFMLAAAAGTQGMISAAAGIAPQLGAHFIQALEASDGTNTNIWVGGSAMHLSATVRA